MYKIALLFLILSFSRCSIDQKQKGNSTIFDSCSWIDNEETQPTSDSLMYSDHPAPLFRKNFEVNEKLQSATLYITAAGYYKASINGQRVGDIYLDPAWTDFSKRIYYSAYDLTQMLKKGKNCLGVTLGNGFYNPLPLRMWGRRNLREVLPTGNPAFIAKLILKYENGKSKMLVTDDSWKFAPGPVVKNNVYLGVTYDANKEITGWNLPEFNDKNWQKANLAQAPGGKLQQRFFPPIKVIRRINPHKITTPEKGVYIVDMGENFAGLYKIRLHGNKGDTLHLRFGERIYDNGTLNPMTTVCGQIKRKGQGGPGAPDIAWQEDVYRFGNETESWFAPEFTFHTYRYIEIKGLSTPPETSDIVGLALSSDVEKSNHFECSSALLNKIQEATVRTFRSNLMSVQSDCPAREKFGYGGDINAVSESYIFNFDMHDFYRKTIYDWLDAMCDSVFVDTAPYVGIQYCGISWESAFLFLQYQLYLYYNDTELVKELYSKDLKWMEKVHRLHPSGLVESGLSDHESLKPVPVELTGTAHYLKAARVMTEFAKVMKDEANEEKFSNLEKKIRQLLLDRFWYTPDYDQTKPINKQTLFTTLLYFNIIPEEEIPAATDSLYNAVKQGINGHFTTGIFGTKFILEALSENGLTDEVFRIVNSTEYPGWGHMIDRGATTLWETWKESDNVYSNCHPMFGSVSEWFYRWLAGIRPDDENPGFQQFFLTPHIPDGLNQVSCEYKSPKGYIRSGWEKTSEATTYHFTVPENTVANLKIATSPASLTSFTRNRQIINVKKSDFTDNNLVCQLTPGEYKIVIKRK